jgi:hypothetical protein
LASTDTVAFEQLRVSVKALDALVSAPAADPNGLAKAYASVARAMDAVAASMGLPSARFRAVVKALDLRTPKSALQAFLDE